ncbi:uncharacterized protein Dwil_GK17371 [Drosophila willistoni]|uniref:Dynein regulatory complex subunit 2 n=1 Tax=Drosophila willistoni TaxID=7260 RepID=B4ML57_DROWI|nr:nuclease SbcCD subunit C [Drosophila willistoni]EDW73115.1 uncharacterized protein Dwil_GK17371 [Drosophila willistoni]
MSINPNAGDAPAEPEIRLTRINDNYLQEMEDEMAKEAEGPRKPTKAEKKAARKEAKRVQAIEDKKLIMRDAFARELELGKRMEKRGSEEWHEMCQEIKIRELREEIVDWGERAARNIERKNDHIAMLLDDMGQTQDQHVKCYSKTIELIDHIRECFHTMLESARKTYEQEAEELLCDYYDEIKRRTEEVEHMHNNSENIIHASNIVTRDQLKEDYDIYLEQRDDRINTEIENRFRIRDQVVHKMNDMMTQLNDFVETLRNTELDAHKYERIRWLTERQQLFHVESRKLTVEELKYQNILNDMHREMLRIDLENNSTINDLRLEFQYFSNVRKKIEDGQTMDDHITHEKLRILSGECYELIKHFEKHVKSGELLLALSITCRKLQTESEKVILGGEVYNKTDLGQINEKFKLETLNMKDHVDMTEDELVELNQMLSNFWHRQAMAQAQNILLLQEKERLTKENQHYIDFIKSMSVTENVEELRSAIKVKPCEDQPMPPFVFDTPCLSYKMRTILQSPMAAKNAKQDAENIVHSMTNFYD